MKHLENTACVFISMIIHGCSFPCSAALLIFHSRRRCVTVNAAAGVLSLPLSAPHRKGMSLAPTMGTMMLCWATMLDIALLVNE
jgi:hypothetical protein